MMNEIKVLLVNELAAILDDKNILIVSLEKYFFPSSNMAAKYHIIWIPHAAVKRFATTIFHATLLHKTLTERILT